MTLFNQIYYIIRMIAIGSLFIIVKKTCSYEKTNYL